jgi:serine phosphatase RsbU (regulator of sigma subunit)
LENLSHTGQNAAGTVTGLIDAVQKFTAGAPQSDDITLIAVRYTPGQ